MAAAVIDLFLRRVVGWSDECGDDGRRCDGDLATGQAECAAASLRTRQPILRRAIPEAIRFQLALGGRHPKRVQAKARRLFFFTLLHLCIATYDICL